MRRFLFSNIEGAWFHLRYPTKFETISTKIVTLLFKMITGFTHFRRNTFYDVSGTLRLFTAGWFLKYVGVKPVSFLNWPDKWATLL